MRAEPVFPGAPRAAGMYESFYLRAVSPREPLAVWLRHTVHKRPGQPAKGSVWCTVFDAAAGAPFMHKETFDEVSAPAGGWIDVGGRAAMGPEGASGGCGAARWSIGFVALAGELRHLRPSLLYRTPLPRTKLTSPAPLARFEGVLELETRPPGAPIDLSGWHGMVGHNWGAEHAARWIWLHGCDFAGAPGAWLDLAVGRVRVGSRLTPWIANGALCFDGAAHRLSGRAAVREDPSSAELELRGGGLAVRASVAVPASGSAGWRYADPGRGAPGAGTTEHDVANCSIAALDVAVSRRGEGGRLLLRSEHGGAYELGMQERDHGVAVAPFPDG